MNVENFKNRYQLVFLLILSQIIIPFLGYSQTATSDIDFHVYTRAGIKSSFLNGISNVSDIELRTKDNSTHIEQIRFNTNFSYKINKYFSTGVGYMFSSINLMNSIPNTFSNRYWVEAKLSSKLGDIQLSARERFQQTFRQKVDAPTSNTIVWRQEVKGVYSPNGAKWKPYLSVETHIYMFNASKGIYEVRYNIGTTYSINKNNDLEIFGRYFTSHDIYFPDHNFVVGINYYFKLEK